MALFLSTYRKKIDKKGRVSVPNQFRAVLAPEAFGGVVVYPSFVNRCIEACGMGRIELLGQNIETLDPFSEEHDAFSSVIFGSSVQLPFDGEGRIVVPSEVLEAAGIGEEAVFVGKGQTFEIWEPVAYEEHARRARELALARRADLRAVPGGAR